MNNIIFMVYFGTWKMWKSGFWWQYVQRNVYQISSRERCLTLTRFPCQSTSHSGIFYSWATEQFRLNEPTAWVFSAEAKFLDEIQTKFLGIFLLAIHSHLYSFALKYFYLFKLTQPLTVFTVQLLYTVKRYPFPFGLQNSNWNLKPENSQDYVQKPQLTCTFMNSASGRRGETWGRYVENMCECIL